MNSNYYIKSSIIPHCYKHLYLIVLPLEYDTVLVCLAVKFHTI